MKDNSFKDFVLGQLGDLKVRPRYMFGGFGLYLGAKFFGIIFDGRLYFKTDKLTRIKYIEQEMELFVFNKKHISKNYYEVPLDIIENNRELRDWAEESASVK